MTLFRFFLFNVLLELSTLFMSSRRHVLVLFGIHQCHFKQAFLNNFSEKPKGNPKEKESLKTFLKLFKF